MHSYEPAPRIPYPNHIPGMRPPRDTTPQSHPVSVTPIYDALYSEYRRSFRALPFDRSGEEELRFVGFGPHPQLGYGQYGGQQGYAGQLGYPVPSGYQTAWDTHYGRQRGHVPALPPAPRDGRMRGY
ncbi:hypothetical protein B7P34_32025 [Streptosporangium nondiastaticum]|uniref:Uncharacterized protein n=2 Tax=Actinomycetes TaxID=1760 RepID=A0A9X7JJD3_9ACTN|nr:hypothetical protein B7P34_32025 [Streptosporangium nondiastaticum]